MKRILKSIIIPLVIVIAMVIGIIAHINLYNKNQEDPLLTETEQMASLAEPENAEPHKYHVTLDSGILALKNDQEYYEEGEEVVVIQEEMMTDTDYTFYINGEIIQPHWENDEYVLRFAMPAEDVVVSLTSRNTMEYNGGSWIEKIRKKKK